MRSLDLVDVRNVVYKERFTSRPIFVGRRASRGTVTIQGWALRLPADSLAHAIDPPFIRRKSRSAMELSVKKAIDYKQRFRLLIVLYRMLHVQHPPHDGEHSRKTPKES